jgi:hypothetical protein
MYGRLISTYLYYLEDKHIAGASASLRITCLWEENVQKANVQLVFVPAPRDTQLVNAPFSP